MEICNIFAPLVSDSEWQSVPTDIAKKINKCVNDELEKLMTAKALSETNRFDAGTKIPLKNHIQQFFIISFVNRKQVFTTKRRI